MSSLPRSKLVLVDSYPYNIVPLPLPLLLRLFLSLSLELDQVQDGVVPLQRSLRLGVVVGVVGGGGGVHGRQHFNLGAVGGTARQYSVVALKRRRTTRGEGLMVLTC